MTTALPGTPNRWDSRRTAKAQRLQAGSAHSQGRVIEPGRLKDLLHDVIRSGDRVALEGDNQKQADFLSRTLADCDPHRINKLHMLISSVSRPEHLDLFERGIAAKLDLAYAGPQSVRIAQMVEDGSVHIGAIHTYVELYARMFVDLALDVVLLCAEKADRDGNLYTGPNTEDTPTIAEAAAFHDGVVIVQADEIVDSSDDLPRGTFPAAGWTTWSPPTGRSFWSRCSPGTPVTSVPSRSSRP
jgi:malonate decarboxylase alpha subunit